MPTILTHRNLVIVAALLAAVLHHRPAAGQTPPATEPTVVFFDDFSGPEINRSNWNITITGQTVNREQQAYVDSPETLSIVKGDEAAGAENGALLIRGVWKPGFTSAQNRNYDFISGRIDTRRKFEFAYGTWAARMKLTASPGLWPAFWALGTGRWPDSGEIDIMENIGQSDWISSALHERGNMARHTSQETRFHFPKGEDITGWHIYSVDWSPDSLVFKVDGEASFTVTKERVTQQGAWAFDNPKYIIMNLALGGNYPAAVNNATTPYRGLPEATVQLIKDGKAKVLVDWVRVTKR
jgi:beta-glucanase (GH16 family)